MVEKSIVQARISGPVAFQYFDRKKVGFSVPLALWLRTELKPLLCDVLSKDGLTAVGYLEHGEVEKLVSEHLSGSANHESKLWALINLFFQAEDGIRYYKVTGVQTCALPI